MTKVNYEELQNNFEQEIFPGTEYSCNLCGAMVRFGNREKHYIYHLNSKDYEK